MPTTSCCMAESLAASAARHGPQKPRQHRCPARQERVKNGPGPKNRGCDGSRDGPHLFVPAGRLLRGRGPAGAGAFGGALMIENLVAAVLAVALLGYLGYSLLRPEKF
ncbi:K(+)-transporting ATPase subunit F [Enemella dayhoffiae]|uniref:K(+)-transporting ATPase subunit F n=1 Tax=Enemella dayhoffiae TaxID=2016507 RepID=A0A255GRZ9_9ACTN|nr:K(+)-transporting ATPase subunit F [Enemella dayhoffiae]